MRHPDMPRTVYAWMWDLLSRGLLWRAMVKNRCKNGDHYWMDTNISQQYAPDGCVIGYLSTRRKPTRVQIDEAESLNASLCQSEGELEARAGCPRLRFLNPTETVRRTRFGRRQA